MGPYLLNGWMDEWLYDYAEILKRVSKFDTIF